MSTDLTVARTIRQQLGHRFVVMTGADEFVGDDNSVKFTVGGNKKRVHWVRVTLNGNDEYDVTFYDAKGETMDLHMGIGVEQLADDIGRFCSLDVRL